MRRPGIIIFSTDYLPHIGGAEIAIAEITSRLPGYDFELITARLDRKLAKEEQMGAVKVHRLGFGFGGDKLLLPLLGMIKIWQLRRSIQVDLFWAMMASYSAGAAYVYNMVNFWRRVPIVLTLQEGDSESHLTKRHFGLIDMSWKLALSRTDSLNAISNFLRARAAEKGYKHKVALVPNGVSNEFLKFRWSKGERETFRAHLGIGEKDFLIVTTGRLVEKNAVDDTIKALGYLPENVKFISVGDGPLRPELTDLVARYNLEKRVSLLPKMRQELLPKYVAAADLFLRPSRSEGLGNSFLESMSLGVPTMGTFVGGIPDFLHDGETGFVCEVGNPQSIADKVGHILVHKTSLLGITKKAKQLISRNYTWERAARLMGEIFAGESKRLLIVTPIYPPLIGGPATHAQFAEVHLPSHGIKVETISLSTYASSRVPIRQVLFFVRLMRLATHADTIYALDPVGVGLPAMIVARLLGKRFVLRIAGDRAWETARLKGYHGSLDEFVVAPIETFPFKVRLYRKIEAIVASRANTVIVPGEYLRHIVLGLDVEATKIYSISNPVSAHKLVDRARLRKRLGFGGRIIFSAGRLVPWKGFDELIGIIPSLVEIYGDLRLFIAGDGPEAHKLELRIKELSLEKYVFLVGTLEKEELGACLRAAHVFVLNTSYEGFSHQVLEAMSLGAPVVTTDIEANRYIIENGKEGLLVPPGDSHALMAAILRLLSDEGLAMRIGEEAHRKSANYLPDNIAETLSNLIYADR